MKETLEAEEDKFSLASNYHYWQIPYSCSDGTAQYADLMEDGTGRQRMVLYEERVEYVARCLEVRLRESGPQLAAIRRGIGKVAPEALLNTVTYSELEDWVCGKKLVDVKLLRRCTVYAGDGADSGLPYNDDSPVIQFFWAFMHSLTDDEKTKFVKFAWGSERIPTKEEDFRAVIRRV